MNHKGCQIEPTISGLYDLTITENGKPVKIVRYISLRRAIEIAEAEMQGEQK